MFTLNINASNNVIQFTENLGSEITTDLGVGNLTPPQIAARIASSMSSAGTLSYAASYDIFSGLFTIKQTVFGNTFELLFASGTQASLTAGFVLGFQDEDGLVFDQSGDLPITSLRSVDPAQSLWDYYADLINPNFQNTTNRSVIQNLVSGIIADGLPSQVLNGYNLNPTIQTLQFSAVPNTGTFTLSYGANTSRVIAAHATSDDMLAALSSMLGFRSITTTGTPRSRAVTVNFAYPSAPLLLTAPSSLLDASSNPITITVVPNTAVGVQLDWLGKYVGVTRSGVGANGQSITLSDPDFILLIRIAIASNNFGSSLSTIQDFLAQFFPGVIFVFDYANTAPMQMSYLIATDAASFNLIQLVLAQDLLPVPMTVQYSVIGAPAASVFFAWSDYINAGIQPANTTPLNSIGGYALTHTDTSFRWMDYSFSLKN